MIYIDNRPAMVNRRTKRKKRNGKTLHNKEKQNVKLEINDFILGKNLDRIFIH